MFVLGGTGLIGSAVVRQLIGRGHELYALARSRAELGRAPGHLDPESEIAG
ncbi:MAG: NAD-dependent epimerase/dehydratase family protein [Bradyrhizobium sp.]